MHIYPIIQLIKSPRNYPVSGNKYLFNKKKDQTALGTWWSTDRMTSIFELGDDAVVYVYVSWIKSFVQNL